MFQISVSNIAWPASDRVHIYSNLQKLGIKGVEVALTKIAPWNLLDKKIILEEKALLESYNLTVSSYQALYFGRPDVKLLGTEEEFNALLDHTILVAQWAEIMSGGGAGVFGAPNNRRKGVLGDKEAFNIGAERFRQLAEAVAPYQFFLALEPAPEAYNGDFLQSEADCAAMVASVNHHAFRLHLDAGCIELGGEDVKNLINNNSDIIGHVHLSRPNLAPIKMEIMCNYAEIFKLLRNNGYDKWISVEMRETSDPIKAIHEAIEVINKSYELL